jgi:hypothetical protein
MFSYVICVQQKRGGVSYTGSPFSLSYLEKGIKCLLPLHFL